MLSVRIAWSANSWSSPYSSSTRARPFAGEFADHDGPLAAVVDEAGLQIVGAEIDEAADGALLADDPADDVAR